MKKFFIIFIYIFICFKSFALIDETEIESQTKGFEEKFSVLSKNYLDNSPYKRELLRAGQLWQFCQEKRSEYFKPDTPLKDITQFLLKDISKLSATEMKIPLNEAIKKLEACYDFVNQEIAQMLNEIEKNSHDFSKKEEAIRILNKSPTDYYIIAVKNSRKDRTEEEDLFSSEDDDLLAFRKATQWDKMALDDYYRVVPLFAYFDASTSNDKSSVMEKLEEDFIKNNFDYNTYSEISSKTKEFIQNSPFKKEYLHFIYYLLDCYNQESEKAQKCYNSSYELHGIYTKTEKNAKIDYSITGTIEGGIANRHELYELRLIMDAWEHRKEACEKLQKTQQDKEEIVGCLDAHVTQFLQDLQKSKYLYEGHPPLPQNILDYLSEHSYKVFFYNVTHMFSEALQEKNLEKKAMLVKDLKNFAERHSSLFELGNALEIYDYMLHIILMSSSIPTKINECEKTPEVETKSLTGFYKGLELKNSCFDEFARIYLSDPFQFHRGMWRQKREGEIAVDGMRMLYYMGDEIWGDDGSVDVDSSLLSISCENKVTTLSIKQSSQDIRFVSSFFTETKKVLFSTGGEHYEYLMEPNAEGRALILSPDSHPIAFIKKLLNERYVKISFSEPRTLEGEVEQEYILIGLNDAIKPIREQCGW